MLYIAARATRVPGMELSPRCSGLIERMGDLACDMWRRAADSWHQRDSSAVLALASADEEMDELHASLLAELASGQMPLPVTMEMTLVARFYERLGDHAVNIARRVMYLAGSLSPVSMPGRICKRCETSPVFLAAVIPWPWAPSQGSRSDLVAAWPDAHTLV